MQIDIENCTFCVLAYALCCFSCIYCELFPEVSINYAVRPSFYSLQYEAFQESGGLLT